MSKSKWLVLLSILTIAALVVVGCATPAPETVTVIQTVVVEKEGQTVVETVIVKEEVEVVVTEVVEKEVIVEVEAASDRLGGWLDTIVMVAEPSQNSAVTRLIAGDIDVFADDIADPESFRMITDMGLNYVNNFGLYDELTINPYGNEEGKFDGTGKVNPFYSMKVREAMNLLINRDYIVQEIYGGLAVPKFFPLTSGFPDYARYIDVIRELEAKYQYDPVKAEEVITAELAALGVTKNANGKFADPDGEEITLVILIRVEDNRRLIGDYIGQQLESIGFNVDYQYKTSSEASVLWVRGDVADGLWHLYTGAWITTAVDRDQGSNFEFFLSPRSGYSFTTLWQSYTQLSDETLEQWTRLANNDFTSMEERKELFQAALPVGMESAYRVWLVDRLSFFPYAANVEVAADLAGGISGSTLAPYTMRFADQEGGEMIYAMGDLLVEPWNGVAGSNWIFDTAPRRFTDDPALVPNPYTGLNLPNHIESATVEVVEGLPVGQTLDWVDFSFVSEIQVPGDAWVDWDAEGQRWITAAEKFPEGLTAKRKSTAVYPADFFETMKWHDGSAMSVADFILPLIVGFDVAREGSPIFDESQVGSLTSFMSAFKGYRLVSTSPMTWEYYSDAYALDAENNVVSYWPDYGFGVHPWHGMAIGYLAEAAGELAFSADKADALEIEQMGYTDGPSLEILDAKLAQAIAEGFVPYPNVLGEYLTADEVASRYANLDTWKARQGHFYLGVGPYYLNKVFSVEKTLTLTRFQDYPFSFSKWSGFGTAALATVELDGEGRVTIGSEATFDIFVSLGEDAYLADDIAEVKYLLFDATGALVTVGEATLVEDGYYTIDLSTDVTGALAEGSNKIEVAVVSKLVSVPSFGTFEFVTAP